MLDTVDMAGLTLAHRPGTSDLAVLREVVTGRCYRRARLGFDVEPGELWLDLGANIGAFAAYAHSRGARTHSYEPEPGCYALLERNTVGTDCVAVNAAVSDNWDETLRFYRQKDPAKQATASLIETRSRGRMDRDHPVEVRNVWAGSLDGTYDGIKMDIEGAEHAILDAGLLPQCGKLVLEYHSSVDRSLPNLVRRLDYLRGRFEHVSYEPEVDRAIAAGGPEYKPFFDRNIFCWGPRS